MLLDRIRYYAGAIKTARILEKHVNGDETIEEFDQSSSSIKKSSGNFRSDNVSSAALSPHAGEYSTRCNKCSFPFLIFEYASYLEILSRCYFKYSSARQPFPVHRSYTHEACLCTAEYSTGN